MFACYGHAHVKSSNIRSLWCRVCQGLCHDELSTTNRLAANQKITDLPFVNLIYTVSYQTLITVIDLELPMFTPCHTVLNHLPVSAGYQTSNSNVTALNTQILHCFCNIF